MEDALQFYGNVQRRFHKGTSAELLQLSARALYDEDSRRYTGGETGKASLLPQAKTQLLKAIHLDPCNHLLRFNAAIVMQEGAVRVLKKERGHQDASKAMEYAAAVANLAMAHRTFYYLRGQGKRAGRVLGIDDQKLEKHILFCHETHGRANVLQQQAEKEVAALEAKRHQSRIELEAAMREKRALEEAEKRRAVRQAADRDAKAKQAQQRLQELQASWADNKVAAEAVAEGDAMKADKRRKKQKQESAVDAIFGGSDSDDGVDYNPDAPEEGVGVDAEEAEYIEGGGDDGNEEAEYVDDGPSAEMKNRKRLLAGTGLETDDEDEGMENAEGGTGPEEEEAPPSGRRLKRRKVEGEEPNEGMENVELQPEDGKSSRKDIFGDPDSDEEQQGVEGEGIQEGSTGGVGSDSVAKANRRAVDLFGESDED